MAQFIGKVQGARGMATRLGHKKSGLLVVGNGWDVGVMAQLEHINGEDVIKVYATGGSNARKDAVLLAQFNGETWHNDKGLTIETR